MKRPLDFTLAMAIVYAVFTALAFITAFLIGSKLLTLFNNLTETLPF